MREGDGDWKKAGVCEACSSHCCVMYWDNVCERGMRLLSACPAYCLCVIFTHFIDAIHQLYVS